jgi:dTDP-4-amino-4,6-dideoxygalactose transaminase
VPRAIPALPALGPAELLARARRPLPFPFGDARTRYFYLARGAVHRAVEALGLVGEEILVPAYHHGVEVEALVHAGAKVRFYGVDRSFRADLQSIGDQLTERTKALYVIHYAGFPQPMDDLLAIARSRGLKVLEDCALSLLSKDGVRPLGTRGDAGIFCLYKTLPVPNGGALWMPAPAPALELRAPGTVATVHQALSSLLVKVERGGGVAGRMVRGLVRRVAKAVRSVRPLAVDSLPVGHRTFVPGQERLGISPVSVALARRLDHRRIVEQRRRNYYALLGRLRDVSTPLVQVLEPGVCPLFYPLWVEDKRAVQARLAQLGVESIDFWSEGSPLVPAGAFPEVEALRRHVLELPIHQDLDGADMEALAGAVRRALGVG